MSERPARFAARPTRWEGVHRIGDWLLKTYSISVDGTPIDEAVFRGGAELAAAALPRPATAPGRFGVGLGIRHHGATGDYWVLAWWDRENELPVRVFLRDGDSWRPAGTSESFCVWDLEIFWAERQAWVETVLADGTVEDYLERHPSGANAR